MRLSSSLSRLRAPPEAPRRRHVGTVVGTRPEAIKMAPVLRALAERGAEQRIFLTGQHADLPLPELPFCTRHSLPVDIREQSPGEIGERIEYALCGAFRRNRPDIILVQGDTTSALAGARAARECDVAIGHVEAGLRSFDRLEPWPEEGNRIAIDEIADLLFAPSEWSAANLRGEVRISGAVHVTGNSGIDALLEICAAAPPPSLPLPVSERKALLVTCHRRENGGPAFRAIAGALKRIVRTLPVEILFPHHLNARRRAEVTALLGGEEHLRLLDPVDHAAMVGLMRRAWAILSDSGGIQEEGPALGKPVLVLRNRTERPEAVESGNCELVGTDPDHIFAAVAALLDDRARYARMAQARFPFGDGQAGVRIADLVLRWLDERRAAPRRTQAETQPSRFP